MITKQFARVEGYYMYMYVVVCVVRCVDNDAWTYRISGGASKVAFLICCSKSPEAGVAEPTATLMGISSVERI